MVRGQLWSRISLLCSLLVIFGDVKLGQNSEADHGVAAQVEVFWTADPKGTMSTGGNFGPSFPPGRGWGRLRGPQITSKGPQSGSKGLTDLRINRRFTGSTTTPKLC